MLSWLIRLLVLVTVIPSLISTGLPLNNHLIPMGKSPLVTIQDMETSSPELMGASPNSKGDNCGGTEIVKLVSRFGN